MARELTDAREPRDPVPVPGRDEEVVPGSSTEGEVRTYVTAPAGDSTEQRDAEAVMLELLGQQLGMTLRKERFPLPDAGWLEVDGVSHDPPALCEVWAHIGPAKSAQKNKVAVDALKLLYVSRFFATAPRKILLFADSAAAKHLTGRSWVGQLLRAEGVELAFVSLPADLVDGIRTAQRRQFR